VADVGTLTECFKVIDRIIKVVGNSKTRSITKPQMRMERLQVPIKFGLLDLKTRFIAQKAWIIDYREN